VYVGGPPLTIEEVVGGGRPVVGGGAAGAPTRSREAGGARGVAC
jgi:hypothetical protein